MNRSVVKVFKDEIIFAFPLAGGTALLRMFFMHVGADRQLPLVHDLCGGFYVSSRGPAVMHVRPNGRFALLLQVGGVNAITGRESMSIARPQNYFATPPQGGIDGYFADGCVHPFVTSGDEEEDKLPLDVTVIPTKAEEVEARRKNALKVGGRPGQWGEVFELPNGGQRQCEPVYEDFSSFGDWDQGRQEKITLWLRGGI